MPRSPAIPGRRVSRACALAALAVLAAPMPPSGSARAGEVADRVISVTADTDAYVCHVIDHAPAQFDVYVIAQLPARLGARFRLVVSPGITGTPVNTVIHAPSSTGDVFSGIEVGYGSCVVTDYLIATITYQWYGTSEPCSYLEVAAHPTPFTGSIDMKDCNNEWLAASTPGKFYVNADLCLPWCTVPVEDSTWGRVKALYR